MLFLPGYPKNAVWTLGASIEPHNQVGNESRVRRWAGVEGMPPGKGTYYKTREAFGFEGFL